MLKRTPFHDFHVQAGAKMVDFAGWEMPLLYRGIVQEHEQTRRSGSIFDVSHMGRLAFAGPDAESFLNRALTRNVAEQKVRQCRYSLVCNDAAGVLDDVIVNRDATHWLVVCNASNREKLVAHLTALRDKWQMNVEMADQTFSSAMVAIQGPKVIDRIAELLPVDVRGLKRYHFVAGDFLGMLKFRVFRTGYTGEDGVEIIFPAELASLAIGALAENDPQATIQPAGLGARDTLRLEAAMPLYGHELSEQLDPLSAGLTFAVDLSKDFVGVEKLREIHKTGPARKLVGLELEGRRIARQDAPVVLDGKNVGVVTSGTFGPTVQKSIAMAYVDANLAEGTQLAVDLKGSLNPAKIVKLPFYKRST